MSKSNAHAFRSLGPWVLSFLMLILVVSLSGCSDFFLPRNNKGALVISFGGREGRSILPPSADINSSAYRITGTGPGAESFGPKEITDGAMVGDLKAGDWSVTIEALNVAGTVIASATKIVTVEMYKTTAAAFNLAPLAGTGDFEVTVAWPQNTTSIVQAYGTLTPAIAGKEEFTLLKTGATLSGGIYSATATISALPTGSYSLNVLFKDGSGAQVGLPRLAATTIYKNMTSSGTISMSENLFPVEAPTFAPSSGTLVSTQPITVSTTSAGTSIYYTTNGADPTMVSTKYVGPITLSGTDSSITLKAIAVRDSDGAASAIFSATYSYLPPPTFSVSSGTYATAQTVTISSAQSGVSIFYTTNGSTPTTSSTAYTVPLTVSQNTTLKAIAVKSSVTSATASASYSIQAATPTALPAAGTYANAQSVTLSSTTAGASIYYTIDGSIPSSTNGALYTAPLNIASTLTLKAIARSTNHANSNVLSATYTISGTVAAPSLSLQSGTYYSTQNLTITAAAGTTIFYTTNGTTYTQTGTNSVTLSISASTFITAYAALNAGTGGEVDSQAVAAQYTIATQVDTPVVSLSPGTYSTNPMLTITCATPSAAVYYTTDGSDPTTSSTQYINPISLVADKTTLMVKVIAIKSGLTNSTIVSGSYRWDSAYVSTPQISPVGGAYTTTQTVDISCPVSGVSIRYTTDGIAPTSSTGTLYSLPFAVSTPQSVKAIAYKAGMNDSTVAQASYTFSKPAPSILVAVGQFKKIAVTWPPLPGAISYNLYYKETSSTVSTSAGGYSVKVENAVSGFTVTKFLNGKQLNNGATFAFILTAVYGSGESVASGIATTTPK